MASQLNELDTESLLVMYLAGELTNGDKAAVERRLAAEPKLAAELDRLRELQAFCVDTLRRGDAEQRLPVSEGVAVRRISRAMQQWQIDRVRARPAMKKRGLPLPWWCYPAAAAAAIIIGFLVWSSRQPVTIQTEAQAPYEEPTTQHDEQLALADWMDSSFDTAAPVDTVSDDSPGTDDNGSIFPTRAEETIQ